MRGKVVYGTTIRYFLEDSKGNMQEVSEEEFRKGTPNKLPDLFKHGTTLQSHTSSCWPMTSQALGVHPDQVAEATERNRRMGSRVTYDKDGLAYIPDRGARRDHLRIEKLHDNNGGYGD